MLMLLSPVQHLSLRLVFVNEMHALKMVFGLSKLQYGDYEYSLWLHLTDESGDEKVRRNKRKLIVCIYQFF